VEGHDKIFFRCFERDVYRSFKFVPAQLTAFFWVTRLYLFHWRIQRKGYGEGREANNPSYYQCILRDFVFGDVNRVCGVKIYETRFLAYTHTSY